MATVAVVSTQAREFRARFAEWRRKQGAHIYAEPPESAGATGSINFSQVPSEFLALLDEVGFQYKKITS
jgi:hypothetical protein